MASYKNFFIRNIHIFCLLIRSIYLNTIMEKILVTGGNGYIGSRLCNTLSKKFKITCLDNLMFNHPFPTNQNNNISYIKGDVETHL